MTGVESVGLRLQCIAIAIFRSSFYWNFASVDRTTAAHHMYTTASVIVNT